MDLEQKRPHKEKKKIFPGTTMSFIVFEQTPPHSFYCQHFWVF